MKTFVKCAMCKTDVAEEKCVFATYKRTIDGKVHYFCCENHAKDFESKIKRKKKK